MGYSPWGLKESDTTEQLTLLFTVICVLTFVFKVSTLKYPPCPFYLHLNSFFIFYFIFIFYLAITLVIWGLSSLTRDRTHVPCSRSEMS